MIVAYALLIIECIPSTYRVAEIIFRVRDVEECHVERDEVSS